MHGRGGGGYADYRGMVQPSQQHVAPCVRGVEWRIGHGRGGGGYADYRGMVQPSQQHVAPCVGGVLNFVIKPTKPILLHCIVLGRK